MERELVTVKEAAALLRVSGQTIRRMFEEKEIEGFKISKSKNSAFRIFKDSLPVYRKEKQNGSNNH